MDPLIFNVPIENMPGLEKQLAKLNKKGLKAGTGELKLINIGETATKTDEGYVNVVKHIVIEGEPPKIAGWTFLARLDHNIDHTGGSNLVYVMPGQVLPDDYRDRPADCEHCGWTRKRRDTYILKNDNTGDLKQVGRTCIQEFIGLDPAKVLAHAQRLKNLYDTAGDAEKNPLDRSDMNDHRFIDLNEFLVYVAMAIRNYGWTSRKEEKDNYQKVSTANRAMGLMFHKDDMNNYYSYNNIAVDNPTDVDIQIAEDAIAWALTQDKAASDFNHNLVTIAATGYVDTKATGTAAYIVQGYLRNQEANKVKDDYSKSIHFAQRGDKIRGNVKVINKKHLEMREWDRFQRVMVRMVSDDGNILVTFSTGSFPEGINIGDKIKIRGTVTKLDEFRGVKQTIINRVQEMN